MNKRERNSFKTPLVVEVMSSGKRFRLHFPFTYQWRYNAGTKIAIYVPVGFITDFASIPRIARMIIPKLGLWNKAAVVHDYLYRHDYPGRWFTRREADIVFRDAMRDLGVAKWKIRVMYRAVRMFGWLAWKKR